jgi:hypothetical protein
MSEDLAARLQRIRERANQYKQEDLALQQASIKRTRKKALKRGKSVVYKKSLLNCSN